MVGPEHAAASAVASAGQGGSLRLGPRQMTLDLGLRQAPGLSDFILSSQPGSAHVLDWLSGWAGGDIEAATLAWGSALGAYIAGESGTGKTHLLQAVLGLVVSRGWGGISLGAGHCQMWDAIDPAWPTLAIIDDCDSLSPEHQHLAFNLFLQAADSRSPQADPGQGPLFILAAGCLPPHGLSVRDDLRTRLAWGLSFTLPALDDEGVRLALMHEAGRRGLHLSDELLHHLLTRFSRNVGQLMALLDRLDDFALAAHRSPTVPLLKQMLALETETP
jgi:DnaA family protein